MTLEPWMIYLVGQCDGLCKGFSFLAVILGGFGIAGLVYSSDNYGRFSRWAVALTAFALLLMIATTFIPSTKTAAAMLVLPPIVNSEAAQTLPKELTDLARDWIRELKPAHKESNV